MKQNAAIEKPTVVTAKDRKEGERASRRSKILEVARELFASLDFEAVTIQMIVERTGCTPPMIYKEFGNKEGLFQTLCGEDFLALRQAFDAMAKIADPIERVRATGRGYVAFALSHPNHYKLMFMNKKSAELCQLQTEVERGNPDEDAYAFLKSSVAEAIAAGRFRRGLNDADLIAQMLWAGVHGIVALHMTHAEDPWVEWRPIAETAEALVDALIRGLTAEGA